LPQVHLTANQLNATAYEKGAVKSPASLANKDRLPTVWAQKEFIPIFNFSFEV